MTVILDPGTKPESYSDGQRRQWQNTAGLWKTDYGSSQSALAAMTADRDTWAGRAHQAYGPNRSWGVPPSFEDQAWTGSGYGQGALWSDAAHDDPDVWNTRFAAGQQDIIQRLDDNETPTTATGTPAWPGQNGTSATVTLTIPKTGHYVVSVVVDCVGNLNSHGSIISVNVGGIISGSKSSSGQNNNGNLDGRAGFVAHGTYTAGQTLTCNVSNAWIPTGSINISLFAHFVPSPSYIS